jgi:F0F1-type ATP synthase assembly protein I
MQKKPVSGPQPMQFVALGGEMASPAVLGILADFYFQTLPAWTIVGAVLGFISVGVHLIKMLNPVSKAPMANQNQNQNQSVPKAP